MIKLAVLLLGIVQPRVNAYLDGGTKYIVSEERKCFVTIQRNTKDLSTTFTCEEMPFVKNRLINPWNVQLQYDPNTESTYYSAVSMSGIRDKIDGINKWISVPRMDIPLFVSTQLVTPRRSRTDNTKCFVLVTTIDSIKYAFRVAANLVWSSEEFNELRPDQHQTFCFYHRDEFCVRTQSGECRPSDIDPSMLPNRKRFRGKQRMEGTEEYPPRSKRLTYAPAPDCQNVRKSFNQRMEGTEEYSAQNTDLMNYRESTEAHHNSQIMGTSPQDAAKNTYWARFKYTH